MRRLRGGELAAFGVALVCALGIRSVQPALAAKVSKVHVKDDTSALPPPQELRALTFGYHAATADVLWASLLVEHGIHFQEKRKFPGIRAYLDGIIELDPRHPMVYAFVDTLVLLAKPGEVGNEEDARAAREYLERGTKERPYDHDVWLHYGQYMAFLAPSFLQDPAEIERWRTEGALAISKSVLLGADPDRSLAAATLLSRAGEKKAAILQLQRAYAIADNPDTRLQILGKLRRLETTPDAEGTVARVEHEWRSRYPFLSRHAAILIGPYRATAACAGPEPSRAPGCAGTWADIDAP
jgi:hypothetical protein